MESNESLVQLILDYESQVEQTMEPVPSTLTSCDELVLDKFKSLNSKYYDMLNRHVEQNGKISDQELSDLFLEHFLNPLYKYLWMFNPELKERFKAANVTQFETVQEHGHFLEDYFFEKGAYVGINSSSTSFGNICSFYAFRIKNKGKVQGDILGNNIELDCIELGDEISPDFQTHVLRQEKHIGKMHRFHMRYDPRTRIIIYGNAPIDGIFEFYKLRASRTNKDVVPRDSNELFNKLVYTGLYGKNRDENNITKKDIESHTNLVLVHESMHDLYHRLLSLDSFSSQTEFDNKNEQASCITELVVAKDNKAYLRLANFIGKANEKDSCEGLMEFLQFSVDYICNNRGSFTNLDLDLSKPDYRNDLFLQFYKLNIDQIRLIAAEFMVKHMPEHVAHLKN